MQAGVNTGCGMRAAGNTAGKIVLAGGVLAVTTSWGKLLTPLAPLAVDYALVGQGYGLAGDAYAAAWQGAEYVSGCRAYGYYHP